MKQAERTPACVSEADMQGRRDLRDVVMVTIDGEDAKDLDDAVSLSFDGTYYYLGVHIADVSNYVQENSALDCEARTRGTSVYLADRVIPMLPHRLSNGICSLNAGVDRLAMSCLMQIDCKGNVIDHEVTESVIRVDRRMSYTQVKEILEYASYLRTEQDGSQKEQDTFWKEPCVFYQECRAIIPMLEKMEELMRILRVKRKKRGAIDFNFPEAKVLLDENGVPMEIVPQDGSGALFLAGNTVFI